MGEKTDRIKRTIKQMGVIFKRMGESTGVVLGNMEKYDKEVDARLKKMGALSN